MATQLQPCYSSDSFSNGIDGAYRKTRYRPTGAIDTLIAEAYRKQRLGDRQAIKAVAVKLDWPAYAVSKRAAELGLTRIKERPWSAAEEGILYRFAHLACTGIQMKLADAGFRRSCGAIAVKARRLRIKSNLDGYSANSLALAFGVDVHKVLNWISRGMLGASRRGTLRRPEQGGDTWWIPQAQVKRFVLRCPEEIDLARVEKFWFLDLITNGKVCR